MRPGLLVFLLGLVSAISAQAPSEWAAEFGPRGLAGGVRDMIRLDDGTGTALFAIVGGDRVLKLVNQQWTEYGPPVLTTGTASQGLRAMTVHDDGNGPSLWVAGRFTIPSSTSPHVNVARLTATGWIEEASFADPVFPPIPTVTSRMTVIPDPAGERLIVAQEFSLSVTPSALLERVGNSWMTILTTGLTSILARQIGVIDEGTGPILLVSGQFLAPGSMVPVSGVAKLVGSQLTLLGMNFSGAPNALAIHDDGQGLGPRLYAGGGFSAVGPTLINGLAVWNGAAWFAVGPGVLGGDIFSMYSHDDGTGSKLYLGGNFNLAGLNPANGIAVWDGTTLSPTSPNGGFSSSTGPFEVISVVEIGPPNNRRLFAAGRFDSADGNDARNVAELVGGIWQLTPPVVGADQGIFGSARRFAVDPDTDRLLVLGAFQAPGGSQSFSRWEEPGWQDPYGTQLMVNDQVNCASLFVSAAGTEFVVGGDFTLLGGVFVNDIARFDGTTWQALGSGFNVGVGSLGSVKTLISFDDGSGPSLWVGGNFFNAGTLSSLPGIARWDGTTWQAASSGLMAGDFEDFHVADLGNGPTLFAGGQFTLSGGALAAVITWTGTSWQAVGAPAPAGGSVPLVRCLLSHDDGNGFALFAGGEFTSIDGVNVANVARFDGQNWFGLGGGLVAPAGLIDPTVMAMTEHNFGAGPRLVAGGTFTTADGLVADCLAIWDGVVWQPLNGLNGPVTALTSFDDGTGSALFVSGRFTRAGLQSSSGIARWGAPSPRVRVLQPLGPGGDVTLQFSNLRPGHELINLFSLEPCSGPVGSGPYVGLCTANPSALLAQSQTPIGAIPFHFIPQRSTCSIGPFPPIPGAVLETRSLEIFPPGTIFSASSVTRFVTP